MEALFTTLLTFLRSAPAQVIQSHAVKVESTVWTFEYTRELKRVLEAATSRDYSTPQEVLPKVLNLAKHVDVVMANDNVLVQMRNPRHPDREVLSGVLLTSALVDINDLLFEVQEAAAKAPRFYASEFVNGKHPLVACLRPMSMIEAKAAIGIDERRARCTCCKQPAAEDGVVGPKDAPQWVKVKLTPLLTGGDDEGLRSIRMELELVSGSEASKEAGGVSVKVKVKVCNSCGMAYYCSRACQEKHWRAGHKQQCRVLRAARRAAMGVSAALAQVQDALGPEYGHAYPQLHHFSLKAMCPLLGAFGQAHVTCHESACESIVLPTVMVYDLLDLLMSSNDDEPLLPPNNVMLGMPECTWDLFSDLNILRSFTPTPQVMFTYGSTDASGRFVPQPFSMGWDINDMTDVGKKYVHDLRRIADAHNCTLDKATSAMHQLRLKRARGYQHIGLIARSASTGQSSSAWFMLDELCLHSRFQKNRKLPEAARALAARFASRYGGFLPGSLDI
jgi:MYND finger